MTLLETDKGDHAPLWQVENARVTAFTSAMSFQLTQLQEWWEEIIGEPPETVNLSRAAGQIDLTSTFDGYRLTLQTKPNRIDWRVLPNLDLLELQYLPTVGPFPESINEFLGLMYRWVELKTLPEINRIAFAIVLSFPVENLEHGQEELLKFMQFENLGKGDIRTWQFHVNRPRVSKIQEIENLSINRLTKWILTNWTVRVQSNESESIKALKGLAVRLALDINTTDEFDGRFERKTLEKLLTELKDLCFEIIEKGDIP